MSDLTAAAEAMGVPEPLVARSAAARAAASGTTAEAILAAWAGGDSAPTAGGSSRTEPEPVAEPAGETIPAPPPDVAVEPAPAEPASVALEAAERADEIPPAAEPEPVAAPGRPSLSDLPAPVLVGRRESLAALILGVLAVFVFAALITVVLPSAEAVATAGDAIPGTVPTLSAQAEKGRTVYLQEGCWTCHTQSVRPIVTDAGLGAVTDAASVDQTGTPTFGIERIGPDLTHVASREPTDTAAWLTTFLANPGSARAGSYHPTYSYLGETRSAALVAYLLESK